MFNSWDQFNPLADFALALAAGLVLTAIAFEVEFRRSVYRRRTDFLRYSWLR
jgi:hypothetical protein